ncbi:lamin tail domain-containing protein 1 [Arvicola amphibius]|uniref:lamin tail domain-containing protein 1 n=1 Tax=Arvicola amphibius TaxID=1047088 RepID=UPI001C083C3F|nr:lamin tail domain-containing protein 1 [Arvicola amphibius]
MVATQTNRHGGSRRMWAWDVMRRRGEGRQVSVRQPGEGIRSLNWSYQRLGVVLCVLETKPRSSERPGSALSHSLEDIRIADVNVKGLFVRLINSSEDKEVEIGNHILQQNVNGHAVSLYRFPPSITMQASSTVTVWAATAEAKPKPPTDFVWEEQNRFRSSPDCTTILCKPNGEAIAWYTPIHWKQAWEKLETDIEFERCSVVIPTMKSHLFGWTRTSASSINKEKQESEKKESSQCQIAHTCPALKREKEISPTISPNRSPWCRSPYASPHPYCSLIESQGSDVSESRLGALLKPQPAKPKSAPATLYACKYICYDTYHNGSWVLIGSALTLETSSPSSIK